MKKYPFVHILLPDDLKFVPHLPAIFSNPENDLDGHEHLFITPHKRVYDIISQYPNVELASGENLDCASLINKYGDRGSWLFVHGLGTPLNTLKIKNKYLHKIIWRTWGHDVFSPQPFCPGKGNTLKQLKSLVLFTLWKKKVLNMHAIGLGSPIDGMIIRRTLGNIRTCYLSYASDTDYQIVSNIKSAPVPANAVPKILLGHSGHTTDNHFEIIDRLCSYNNENFTLYIALSYGNEEYIKKVRNYAFNRLGDKVVIIDKFMSFPEYAAFLNGIDVAILDGKKSYALANIGMLLLFRKKLIFNRNGIIKAAFDSESIPHGVSDEIGKISFADFITPEKYDDREYSFQTHSFEYNLNNWKVFLEELKNYEEQV